MTVLYIGKGVLFLTEILIAMNRFTVFRFPFHHQQLWCQTSIIIVCVAVWTISIIASLPFVFSSDRVKFVFAPNGILQMYGGTAYDSIHSVVLLSLVVIICTTLYCSALRYTRNNLTSSKLTVLDRNLLLCALFSALPILAELVRSVIGGYATLFENKALYAIVTEWSLYQMEIIVTLPAWLQLLINVNLRCIVFGTLKKSSTTRETQRTRTSVHAWR
ncbi:unnamed protein product [Cylicocyclus nassatus]|uniref:Serpentine receptor class gamma n=1 Tax=Cylicocyclus nassatus TaxID=53992 RepID=A0AA36MB11_CYLNA|nr:unnamed protein product [Cylicocyclus nassatus]